MAEVFSQWQGDTSLLWQQGRDPEWLAPGEWEHPVPKQAKHEHDVASGEKRELTPYPGSRRLNNPMHLRRVQMSFTFPISEHCGIKARRILGIAEAKKVTLVPQNVLTQAQRYSRGAITNPLNYDGFYVPLLYSTNGEVLWFQDVRHPLNRSRLISQFHTPAA